MFFYLFTYYCVVLRYSLNSVIFILVRKRKEKIFETIVCWTLLKIRTMKFRFILRGNIQKNEIDYSKNSVMWRTRHTKHMSDLYTLYTYVSRERCTIMRNLSPGRVREERSGVERRRVSKSSENNSEVVRPFRARRSIQGFACACAFPVTEWPRRHSEHVIGKKHVHVHPTTRPPAR